MARPVRVEPMPTKNPSSTIVAWLQLIRLPNAFTVVADVLAGTIVARGNWDPLPLTIVLVAATCGLYWSGMILNDVYDVDRDRAQNRGRPLADGRIALPLARYAGFGLMGASILAVLVISGYYGSVSTKDLLGERIPGLHWSTPLIAIFLGLSIWLYDGPLKKTALAPALMGLCRVGSLLMGISIGWWLTPVEPWTSPHHWFAAVGNGVYIMGITWAARREAELQQTSSLPWGWGICIVGIILLASVSRFAPHPEQLRLDANTTYPLAIALLALPWGRRALRSLVNPHPVTIQAAVKQAILSLIFFDAMLALQFGGPWPAIAICSLIVPAMLLGRYFRST